MMRKTTIELILATLILCSTLTLVSCGSDQQTTKGISSVKPGDGSDLLNVVATSTIVGDVVHNVGGSYIDLTVLFPFTDDPHGFQPTPRDVAALNQADIIFINGLGFESFLEQILETAVDSTKVVSVSDGIEVIQLEMPGVESEPDLSADPHVWFDPTRVIVWVDNIEHALSQADPENMEAYKINANQYKTQLVELDNWISTRIEELPAERRIIVSDHESLAYLADRYDFELVGTVIPGTSTLSEPSAQHLAQLGEKMERLRISAIFVGKNANNKLVEQIAQETSVEVIPIFTGSLTDADGEVPTYLEFMRVNIDTIIEGLQK